MKHLSCFPTPIFHICAEKHFLPNEIHITRFSGEDVLILMREGVLRFMEAGKEIVLHPGEYYIQEKGLFQEGVPLDSPPIYDFLHFNGTFTESQDGLAIRGFFNPSRVLPLFDKLNQEQMTKSENSFYTQGLFLQLIGLLISPSSGTTESDHTASRIRNWIHAQYTSVITISDLSKRFGYSEKSIVRLFKQKFNTTPHQYQMKLRLEQANWLLSNTDLTAEQIALTVGYSDYSAFFRSFRAHFSYAPGHIRKACK